VACAAMVSRIGAVTRRPCCAASCVRIRTDADR
jgi:hypothetical protein